MAIAPKPSYVVIPADTAVTLTVVDFLIARFGAIPEAVWRQRVSDGKVHWRDGSRVTAACCCRPQQRVCYYREVETEPDIPFQEQILFEDEHILVADKPHFLPVTPGGNYVRQCLLYRLKERTGIDALQPIHRIDRDTAGVVVFSKVEAERGQYQRMFIDGDVMKRYFAIAEVPSDVTEGRQWRVENRMVKAQQNFRMRVTEGEVNARSTVACVATEAGLGLFDLSPLSGKTHQLRVHMSCLNLALLHDRYYPDLLPKAELDFEHPMQLLSRHISFTDPVTGESRHFDTTRVLAAGFAQRQREIIASETA
ncbi:pseudouridine synthase [Marinobacterium jannaschii]|uniref:pseudouridine synthase n=1 Tax=Marinobacterium jannaschii TaxID=64970 RepID=UPI0006850A8A|nr:pseudouridine synthase [Marinobacterium jannaschii]